MVDQFKQHDFNQERGQREGEGEGEGEARGHMSYPHLEWQARWIEALKNAARKSKVEELGGEDLLENPVRVRLHTHRHIHTH